MWLRTIATAGCSLVTIARAFQDTSPFLAILPTSFTSDVSLHGDHFATVAKINTFTDNIAASCPSSAYVIISQPGLSSSELQQSSLLPHLGRRSQGSAANDESASNVIRIPEVVGRTDADAIAKKLSQSCGGAVRSVNGSDAKIQVSSDAKQIIKLDFAPLPHDLQQERGAVIRKNDATLNALLTSLEESHSITLLFTTTPVLSSSILPGSSGHARQHTSHSSHNQHPLQVVDFDREHDAEEPVHMAWKRDVDGHIPMKYRRQEGGSGNSTNARLFETYNFLTPGIFMGAIALILLLSMLLVGMNAVAGIDVSYQSFNKEMVQAMAKAQKQQ